MNFKLNTRLDKWEMMNIKIRSQEDLIKMEKIETNDKVGVKKEFANICIEKIKTKNNNNYVTDASKKDDDDDDDDLDWLQEKNMGGAAGHMKHPFETYDVLNGKILLEF